MLEGINYLYAKLKKIANTRVFYNTKKIANKECFTTLKKVS